MPGLLKFMVAFIPSLAACRGYLVLRYC